MKHKLTLLAATCLACLPLYGPPPDFSTAHHFTVEIEGLVAGSFQEVSGLSSEIEVIEYQDGTDLILRKRPGRTKYSNITLKRGYVGTSPIMDWFDQLTQGLQDPRSVSIILQNEAGAELGRWNLFNCWPSAWKVTGVQTGGMTLVEEIQMEVEFATFETP